VLHKLILFLFFTISFGIVLAQTPINRKELVQRHTITNKTADPLTSLSVGNGKFAFTVDVTGLQTFPLYYEKGVPLGTQSEWGWHSFIDTAGYQLNEAMRSYDLNGRAITYAVQWNEPERNKNAANWFRQNPHRLQLGNLGFAFLKTDGSKATVHDIENIHQQLDLWTGGVKSYFTIEGIPVEVFTYSHQVEDVIAVSVKSNLLREGRLKIRLRFPYPTGEWTDVGTNYKHPEKHLSSIESQNANRIVIKHQLDTTKYYAEINCMNSANAAQQQKHDFIISPIDQQSSFSFSCSFSPNQKSERVPDFYQTELNSIVDWQQFWNRGGAIDFSGSIDSRANELERRIILSQYLTKIQCAGSYPPQETGLTYNSWFGKPHLEMHWWHGAHFALWGRNDLLEKSLAWYEKVAQNARDIASRQRYEGIRWQKMTDHNGSESPSSVGAFLIWQQPHYIYFAELIYRQQKNPGTLNKYKNLVFATADFMASYAFYDKEKDKYILGKGLIPAQERFKPEETFNPTYELAYWHWALNVAQSWRARLKMPHHRKWDSVLRKLSPLPVLNNVYLAAESAPDSYTNPEYKTDHPSVFGALGMLPMSKMVDKKVMANTFDLVWNTWSWNETWGWDFPMTAMTATRLGLPEKAIDALLMNIQTNKYLVNGHNYQDDRLRLYLPGNGGLLAAIAMMCAGFDGSNERNPGIPKNGKWKVKWEGLKKMP
jgi:hypothetical protein